MSFGDWMTKLLVGEQKPKQSINIETGELVDMVRKHIDPAKWNNLALYNVAVHSAARMIANALSKAEFRTYDHNKEIHGEEYYLWNYEPNRNQNASQFMSQLINKLIFDGEALVIQSQEGYLLIADSFVHEQYAIYQDTFKDVTVLAENGHSYTFSKTFLMKDVHYYKLHDENISSMLGSLADEYNEMISTAVRNFAVSGGEHGVLSIAANAPARNYGTKPDGTPRTFNDVYSEMMQNQFANYFKNANAVMPLFDGFTYDTKGGAASKRSTSEVKDIQDLTDEVYEAVARAFCIPVSLLKGDVANTDELMTNFVSFAVDPFAKLIERENNRKRYGKAVLTGSRVKVDTTRCRHLDLFKDSSKIDKILQDGVLCVDEIRHFYDEAPLNTKQSTTYFMTKNIGTIDDMTNGGNTNGKNDTASEV